MRKMKKWMLATILICGTTMVLTSCSSQNDNPTPSTTLPKSYHLVAARWVPQDVPYRWYPRPLRL
jgi:hypothetical protein